MRTRFWIAALLLPLAVLPASPAAAGGGCRSFTDGTGPAVDAKHNCFAPTVARVDPGDTVTWRNTDGLPHNIVTTAGFGGDLPVKASSAHRFTEPGVYPYVCTLHPGMVGAVVVGDGVPLDMELASADTTGGQATPASGVPGGWMGAAGALALLVLALGLGRRRRHAAD